MQGQINATFGTFQADMFESGLAAEVGANPFFVWLAIKAHADFNTGEAWPSIRRLAEITGLGPNTVQRAVGRLQEARLLRVVKPGTQRASTRYVARERLDVKLGGQLLCAVVIDYVPAQLRNKIKRIQENLKAGESVQDDFSEVEIIPGPGFVWDPAAGVLRSMIAAKSIPGPEITGIDGDAAQFAKSALALKCAEVRAKLAEKGMPKHA